MLRTITALALLITAPAQAGFVNGNRLHGLCTARDEQSQMTALGYSLGVLDAAQSSNGMHAYVCVPDGVNASQVKDVACAYLEKHPEARHGEGSLLVLQAVLDAWGCLKNPPAK